jgi:hypothetical protein
MFDTTIRGGTIVDGSGNARFSGDIGISGGRIAAVGGKLSPGKEDIDASGALVRPPGTRTSARRPTTVSPAWSWAIAASALHPCMPTSAIG